MTGTGDRAAYLRVAQHYGQLLADFRRRQADIAAEYDAKIATLYQLQQPPDQGSRPAFDEDDFSHHTWLR